MDGVGISIIERPRPLHNHDTPNPTHHTYTLKCEEPVIPAQATEALASTCGPGVAVSKQLMGAAVSGLVAGVCFSVVNRLLSRR